MRNDVYMTHCDAARSARRDAHPLKALQTCVAAQRGAIWTAGQPLSRVHIMFWVFQSAAAAATVIPFSVLLENNNA
jgi:hypothetical protein